MVDAQPEQTRKMLEARVNSLDAIVAMHKAGMEESTIRDVAQGAGEMPVSVGQVTKPKPGQNLAIPKPAEAAPAPPADPNVVAGGWEIGQWAKARARR